MTTKLSLLRVFADNSAAANSKPDTKDGVMYLNATLLYHRARWFCNTFVENPRFLRDVLNSICERSLIGRALPFQGKLCGFKAHRSLHPLARLNLCEEVFHVSKAMDRWLDICTLLRSLQSDEKVEIIPATNDGSTKRLGFQVNYEQFRGDYKDTFIEVLTLSDWFEGFIDNGKLIVTLYVLT